MNELTKLIEEQRKDDVYTVRSQRNTISLDAPDMANLLGVDESGALIDLTPNAPSPVGGREHGTVTLYNAGCKCYPCARAKADYQRLYMREYRARKKQ